MSETPSPCLNICEIDPGGELCRGCGRTLDEIASWQGASEAERLAIVEQLPERLSRLTL